MSGGLREVLMKRMMMVMVVVAASTGAMAAGLDLPHGKWWENERVVQRIGLTADQQVAISDLVYRHAHRMIDLNAGVKKAELELAELVDRTDLDPDAVRKAFAAFQTARQRLENERFEMLLAVRATLTGEQWQELLEMKRQLDRLRENRPPGDRMQRPPYGDRPQRPEGGGFG